MIIAEIYNPRLTPQKNLLHPDFKSPKPTRSTYVLDQEYSDYCKNNDVVYYDVMNDDYLEDLLEDFFPKDLLTRIKNKDALLAIDLSEEAFFKFIDLIYQNLVIKQGIPAEQILLISNSLEYKEYIENSALKYNHPKIKCECYNFWERIQKKVFYRTMDSLGFKGTSFDNFQTGLYKNTNKKFLYLNNAWREHRVALLCALYGNGLLSHSHASFSLPISKEIYQFKTQGKYTPEKKSIDFDSDMIESNWSKWYHNTLDLFDNDMLRSQIVNGNDIKNFLPLILDSNSFTQIMAWNDHNHLLKYYNDSYFSVVTETSFFRNISEKSLNYHLYKQSLTPISITEKIYKAIAHKHPFIYVSIDGALELLKSFGYKTYDTIIDESYSREPDPYKRMLKIIDEIKRLSNLNSEQLIEFKTRCKEIAEYNFNVFINKQNYIIRVT